MSENKFAITAGDPGDYDRSEFHKGADGIWRASIRGFARVLRVDESSLRYHFKSAGLDPSDLAKSLLATGFCPAEIEGWSTEGIPEQAMPVILTYYAYRAQKRSALAERILMAFAAVGIHAYLDEVVGGVRRPAPRVSEPSDRALSPAEVIALLERGIDLCERLGGLDERDELLYKDIVRTKLLAASSGLVLDVPADEEITLGDAWLEVFGEHLPRSRFSSVGKFVAKAYRKKFGKEPPCRLQFVDGAPRQVKSYQRSWLIETLNRFRLQLAGG